MIDEQLFTAAVYSLAGMMVVFGIMFAIAMAVGA